MVRRTEPVLPRIQNIEHGISAAAGWESYYQGVKEVGSGVSVIQSAGLSIFTESFIKFGKKKAGFP